MANVNPSGIDQEIDHFWKIAIQSDLLVGKALLLRELSKNQSNN